MKKFIILYGAYGYDGDDDFLFGQADFVAIKDTRKEAEARAEEEAQDIVRDFTIEEDGEVTNKIYVEREHDGEGNLTLIRVDEPDEMFPHQAIVRIVEVDL